MDSALIDTTSEQFLGQWKRLVSTTNWEKGKIIFEWRESLRAADVLGSEYSDEAWSRRVGNVTPQHVGRLRRVYERFAATRAEYVGLYWSHFQAALDWDDAEMWLEGAVQSEWSISEMRHERWQALGAVAADEPGEAEGSLEAPWDEDAENPDAGDALGSVQSVVQSPETSRGLRDEDADERDNANDDRSTGEYASHDQSPRPAENVAPFASLPPLPPDVNDAFEAYKLCILRHKLAGWQEISRDDILASLDSLKQLALAPADI